MPLATRYLGLYLRSPFIVGSSPLCDEPGMARQLQEAGAGAVVMRSLFMEQFGTGPAPGWQTGGADYHHTPEGYLRHLEVLKKQLSIPSSRRSTAAGAAPGWRWRRCLKRQAPMPSR